MLRYPKLPENAWVRVCQECGNEQVAQDPRKSERYFTAGGWRDVKCRRCHSTSLDYGMPNGDIPISDWD